MSTPRPWSARRQACEELARMLASEPGLHEARLLQLLGMLDEPPGARRDDAAPEPTAAPDAPAPVAIGIWQPRELDGELLFERRAPDAETDALWAPAPVLTARKREGVRRVCLLGESAATGWFYAPRVTPALVLERHLRGGGGPGAEVIDLARVDLGQAELLALARAALQLGPDALVVYAGNNWGVHFRPADPPSTVSAHTAARAYRDGGAAALARITRQAVAHDAKQTVDALARIAGRVPVVLVVPEVNLRDWERARPVPWLPGDATARWHDAYGRAIAAAGRGDWAAAGDLAREMVALDAGCCATSHRLLAWAALARGDGAAAACAARAEVDARSWDNHPHTPGATSDVQRALRAGAAEHGFHCVDLPLLFAGVPGSGEAAAAAVPGRELLLDYCHLTPQGMEVAMAGVAAALGGTARGDPAAGVTPEADARAKWLSALYAAHWSTRRCGEQGAVAHWIERALDAWPGIADEMLDYALSRCARPAWLQLSRRHQALVAGTEGAGGRVRRVRSLDPEVVEAVAAALEGRGRGGVRGAIADAMAGAMPADAEVPDETDLLDPAHYWNVVDGHDARSAFTHPRLAFYRALWPVSRFALPSDGRRAPRLRLTARLPAVDAPRSGVLEVALGGTALARVTLGAGWSTTEIAVPEGVARPGLNQLVLRWPPVPPSGDAAMREIARRLELGVPTDLHPAFGELSRLVARTRI